MIVMAVLNTINMGCALDMSIVKKNILRPVGPIVGFVSQFTFMPLVRASNGKRDGDFLNINKFYFHLGFLWTSYAFI